MNIKELKLGNFPICPVCQERHKPARMNNNGPARCWHCGQTEKKCTCIPTNFFQKLLTFCDKIKFY